MTDPLDRLRSTGSAEAPSLATIKSRAMRVQRRRYTMIASCAAFVLILAGAGLFARTSPSKPHQQASGAAKNAFTSGGGSVNVSTAAPSVRGLSGASKAEAGTSSSGSAASALSPGSDITVNGPRETLLASIVATKKAPGETFTLQVCNATSSTVTRSFPTSQRYDFLVSSRSASKVWQWSDGQAFADHVGSETWKPKECKSWTAYWNGTTASGGLASPGSYEVQGTMTSNPRLQSVKLTFCLDVCS
jgi:hypothetical protein